MFKNRWSAENTKNMVCRMCVAFHRVGCCRVALTERSTQYLRCFRDFMRKSDGGVLAAVCLARGGGVAAFAGALPVTA